MDARCSIPASGAAPALPAQRAGAQSWCRCCNNLRLARSVNAQLPAVSFRYSDYSQNSIVVKEGSTVKSHCWQGHPCAPRPLTGPSLSARPLSQ